MRTCPSCQRSYPGAEIACAGCGTALIEDVAMSDTHPAVAAVAVAIDQGPDPLAAALAGKYEIIRKVGEGGMGAVYEARHIKIGKRVAIKVLLEKYVQKADVVARLVQEARLASSIGHENIIDIADVGETDDGRTFVVMEFLEGDSLHDLLVRDGSLPPARALPIIRQVASALGAAHEKGVVHRDVKPENVFITRRGDKDFVKVVDFGISKAVKPEHDGASSPRLTTTGMILGTPLYLSPEQARGEEDLDHRIDIYALGVVLYETLTGEVPFHGANYLSIISQILEHEATPPSELRVDLALSPDIDAVVAKAMAKDRDLRYRSMAELDADLARLESGAHPRAQTVPPLARRRWVTVTGWTAGIAGIAVAVALIVPRLLSGEEPRTEAPPPEVVTPVPMPILPPPPAPVPATIRVTVTSTPPGADVWWADVKKGVTPTEIELPRSEDRIELVLKRDGFEDARATFYPTRDQQLPVTLTKKPPPRPPRRTAQRPPIQPPDRGPTSGGEIKASPYGGK